MYSIFYQLGYLYQQEYHKQLLLIFAADIAAQYDRHNRHDNFYNMPDHTIQQNIIEQKSQPKDIDGCFNPNKELEFKCYMNIQKQNYKAPVDFKQFSNINQGINILNNILGSNIMDNIAKYNHAGSEFSLITKGKNFSNLKINKNYLSQRSEEMIKSCLNQNSPHCMAINKYNNIETQKDIASYSQGKTSFAYAQSASQITNISHDQQTDESSCMYVKNYLPVDEISNNCHINYIDYQLTCHDYLKPYSMAVEPYSELEVFDQQNIAEPKNYCNAQHYSFNIHQHTTQAMHKSLAWILASIDNHLASKGQFSLQMYLKDSRGTCAKDIVTIEQNISSDEIDHKILFSKNIYWSDAALSKLSFIQHRGFGCDANGNCLVTISLLEDLSNNQPEILATWQVRYRKPGIYQNYKIIKDQDCHSNQKR